MRSLQKNLVAAAVGALIPAVAALVKAGYSIGSVDLLYTGEFTSDGRAISEARIVDNPREFAGYTLGYNHPLVAQRAHDILTLITFAKHHQHQPEQVHLVGVNGAAPSLIPAAAIAGNALSSVAVDTAGYRYASITDIRDVNLLPGAVKYGDLPGLAALIAPVRLLLAGETTEKNSVPVAAWAAANSASELQFVQTLDSDSVVRWIQAAE